jgi:RNA polymerase sigma-70 factor (ECF subfamily)
MGNPEFNPDIMDRLKEGDADAFGTFFTTYYPPLCYFGFQLIRDRPAAEDIVKDTFIKLWQKQQDFGTPQNVKAFLYITVRNACLNYLRHMQVREATNKELSYLGMDREEAYVLNSMIRTEVMQEIHAEIEKFPEKRRHIFKLAYLEGLKNEEIANMLNISISTVKTQKARAILALRVHFTDHQLVMLFIFYSQCAAAAIMAHACM